MPILSIMRDWGVDPSLVRITSDDGMRAISAAGYLTDQNDVITALNSGEWTWLTGDMVLVNFNNDRSQLFSVSSDFTSLLPRYYPIVTVTAHAGGGKTDASPLGAGVNVISTVATTADSVLLPAAENGQVITVINDGANAAQVFAEGTATINGVSNATGISQAAGTVYEYWLGNNDWKTISGTPVPATQLQYATVAITAAQFNGMYAAPKLLVAAPGANKLIVLDKLDLLMTYGSANYAAGGVTAVQYDSTANGAGVIASTTLSAATFQASASTGFMFNTGVVPQTFSTCVNKGLYLSNITGAFTTGDSTFVAHIWYKVIPTA